MASATEPGTGRRVDDLSPELVTYYRDEGWTIEEDAPAAAFPVVYENGELVQPPVPLEPGEYNPADHTVPEVNKYLETADVTEVQRVFELERAGEARKGILGDGE